MRPFGYVSLAVLLLLAAPAGAQSPEEREASGLLDEGTTVPAPDGPFEFLGGGQVLAVVESGSDQIILLDPVSGNLIDAAFLTVSSALGTPKDVTTNFDGDGLFVVDQIDDVVYEFSSTGDLVGVFAPAGGPNTAILDNAVCVMKSPSGTELWVCVTGGANQDAIARFDQSGAYLGNLIANGAGGLDGPFDVEVYNNALLVTAIGTDDILRYTLAGAFIDVFHASDGVSGIDFPQQMDASTTSGTVLAAGFSAPTGVFEYNSSGVQIGLYAPAGATGNRGVYELPGGTILTTNGTGVHEITRAGALVRTIVAGNAQYIELVDLSAVPVEMTSFTGTAEGLDAVLRWATASETNNAGFEVQTLRGGSWAVLGFVEGHGTTTEARRYAYRVPALTPGTHQFRLRQVDFDGASELSESVEVTVGVPGTHVLSAAYPNPFNPQTSFTLAVARTQAVTVELFDALGRRVAVLFRGTLDGGQPLAITVDGSALPSGLYHYRVSGETFAESRRVVLIK